MDSWSFFIVVPWRFQWSCFQNKSMKCRTCVILNSGMPWCPKMQTVFLFPSLTWKIASLSQKFQPLNPDWWSVFIPDPPLDFCCVWLHPTKIFNRLHNVCVHPHRKFLRFSSLASWRSFMHWNPMFLLIFKDEGSWSWIIWILALSEVNHSHEVGTWYCCSEISSDHVSSWNSKCSSWGQKQKQRKPPSGIRFRLRFERSTFTEIALAPETPGFGGRFKKRTHAYECSMHLHFMHFGWHLDFGDKQPEYEGLPSGYPRDVSFYNPIVRNGWWKRVPLF